jgi:hypothetical protein
LKIATTIWYSTTQIISWVLARELGKICLHEPVPIGHVRFLLDERITGRMPRQHSELSTWQNDRELRLNRERGKGMKCTDLAERIEQLCPAASAQDVARLCLLLTNSSHRVEELANDDVLVNAWNEMDSRLRAATDQHEAMTADLQRVESESWGMGHEQIWRLIGTIKAQSRLLQLYVGGPQVA